MGLLKPYRLKVASRSVFVFALLLACVDPIEFDVPPASYQLVVEGQITNDPGPYIVKLSRARSIGQEAIAPEPVLNARVTLFDDKGNQEEFVDQSNGSYATQGVMRGEIGNLYHVRIETEDGNVYESEPDRLNAVGEVKNIRYEYEAGIKVLPYGEFRDDIFNIFIDASTGPDATPYVRWRFTGTYRVESNPELHMTYLQGEFYFKTPRPCSGYVVIPFIPGGKLEKREECTCCICWANHYEDAPQLSDTKLISGDEFRNIKVGVVPINSATFFDKYLVQVDQISLSKQAFDFFKEIRSQKEGALSLFQPPSAEIKGNIRSLNGGPVVGLFYASSVSKKTMFITPDAVPYLLPPIDLVTKECFLYYENASVEKPDSWK